MKFTYDIHVESPRSQVTYVSANLTREVFSGGVRHRYFSNQIPTAGYLIAVVSGDLVERQVGAKTYVISEPDNIDAASAEFDALD